MDGFSGNGFSTDTVRLRLLGPVEIQVGDQATEAGRPQQRLLLAALAVDAGRPVTIETLIDRVWDEAPDGARRTLHVLVTRVRRALQPAETAGEPVLVVRRGGGYALQVDSDHVDLLRYRRLVGQARAPQCSNEERVSLLREALGLWRGEPLSGLPGRWAARTRRAWWQQHVDTTAAWAGAELQAGNAAAVIDLLSDLVGEHPFAEPLTAVLMQALHTVGRPADALALYQTLRERLAEELGTDPAPEPQRVYQQILRGESATPPTPPRRNGATTGPAVPRQLPAAIAHFVGRTDQLRRLTGLLDTRARAGGTVIISAIGGTAGVGKSAVAVHWAHQVADQFPDGQLYVNLRGFDPGGAAMDPAAAMRGFLDALGAEPSRIPADLDAQATLYRSHLAGKRMLVVLDNARDTAQVRPLLPGTPGCLVLVTSRNQLTGLIAADGAHPITLDLFTEGEARHLLAQRLGAERLAAEPDAVADIITGCARLPLALALVASHAALRPDVALRVLADELLDSRHRWKTLISDEPTGDVQAVLSWSYQTLAPDTARLFRLLGIHPGPDLSTPAAASLADAAPAAVRSRLAELTRASLLVEHAPGRFTFHDLLRAYARDLAHRTDSGRQRHDAMRRLLDYYLHTARAAAGLLFPTQEPITLGPPGPGVALEPPADRDQARTWFADEHATVLAALEHAAANGFDTHAWQLASRLLNPLDTSGYRHELAATQRIGLSAAQRVADPPHQARAHRYLAVAYYRLQRFDDALTHLRHSLDLLSPSTDQADLAHTHLILAAVHGRKDQHADAIAHSWQAHDLFKAADSQAGQANALNNVGWYHTLLGEHRQALGYCRQALTLNQEAGNRHGEASTWDSLGHAHKSLGDHSEALACYRKAIDLRRELGDRPEEAGSLEHAGDVHHAAGNLDAARDCWRQALAILQDIEHPDVDKIQAKLRGHAVEMH